MREAKLYIYKQPELHNPNFEHKKDTNGGFYDNWWNIPAATVFDANGLVPYPDDLSGTYAISQDFGLKETALVRIGIVVAGGSSPLGTIDVGVGNSHQNITTPGTHILDFTVTSPDATFGYDIVIRGSGGTYIPGNAVSGMGIKSVYIISAQTQTYNEVDLYDNIDIPITYNVADVRDISKKDSNFSLTFEIPNTPRNTILFDVIHEIADYGSSFELLKQYPAFIEVGGNRTFEGYLRLTKVIINDENEIHYECNLYSNFIEFVKRLGTTTLRGNENPLNDLSFSEYTKTLTVKLDDPLDPDYPGVWFEKTDMFTWDYSTLPWTRTGEKPYGKDFFFAPVDKFNLGTRNPKHYNPFPGVTYNYIPMYFDELTPFLFVKEIWDKIFEQVGFSYVSDFINNTANNNTSFEFDHLVYPATNFNVGTLKDYYSIITQTNTPSVISSMDYEWHRQDDSQGRVANPTLSSGRDVYYNNSYQQLSLSENPTGSTQFGIYTTQCWKYTVPAGGAYSVHLNLKWGFDVLTTDYMGNSWQSYLGGQMDANPNAVWRVAISLVHHSFATNTDTTIAVSDSGNQSYESSYNFSGGVINMLEGQNLQYDGNLYLEAGDYLYLYGHVILQEAMPGNTYVMTFGGTDKGQWGRINFNSTQQNDETIKIRLLNEFYINSIFDPTIILNPNTKKLDFVNNIIKKFNLYVEDVTNKRDSNGIYYRDYTGVRPGEPILRIEPRGMYYDNNSTVRNLTDIIDSSSMEFVRIDDYIYKRLNFNDKYDLTHHTKDYNEHNYIEGEYGEEKIISQFNTSEEEKIEIQTLLGQTMCGRLTTQNINLGQNPYTQCPFIFTLEDDGTVKEDKVYEDRMLFIYDLCSDDFPSIFSNTKLHGFWLHLRDNVNPDIFPAAPPEYAIATYCLLDTFNTPFGTETADLNWGWANWYYQNLNNTWATPNNCYNRFYKEMIDDYNDPNARMLTCYMYIPSLLIKELQLSDTIIIKNMAYHINKIDQWKSENEPVKVELIKILTSNIKASKVPDPAKKGTAPSEKSSYQQNTPPHQSNNDILSKMKMMEELIHNMEERINKLEGS